MLLANHPPPEPPNPRHHQGGGAGVACGRTRRWTPDELLDLRLAVRGVARKTERGRERRRRGRTCESRRRSGRRHKNARPYIQQHARGTKREREREKERESERERNREGWKQRPCAKRRARAPTFAFTLRIPSFLMPSALPNRCWRSGRASTATKSHRPARAAPRALFRPRPA